MTVPWTILIATVLLGLAATLVVSRIRPGAAGFLIAAAAATAGVVGALVIVAPRMDLVPDDLERLAAAGLIVLGSLGLIIATWLRARNE